MLTEGFIASMINVIAAIPTISDVITNRAFQSPLFITFSFFRTRLAQPPGYDLTLSYYQTY